MTRTIQCRLQAMVREGLDQGLIGSNDDMTRVWRAGFLGDYQLRLKGGPVSAADLAREGVIRLWEYGVGDTVRMSTFAAVRRVEPGVYEVTGNVDVEVSLNGVARKMTAAEFARGSVRVKATR